MTREVLLDLTKVHKRIVETQEEADAFVRNWHDTVTKHMTQCSEPACPYDAEALALSEEEVRSMVVVR